MPNSKLFLAAAGAALSLGCPAKTAELGPRPLSEVVVTAGRSPERADRVGQQVTIVDAERLRELQTPVLTDVLARTPGLGVSRNGPVGSVTQVYVRGAEPGHTVVLIDGVKLNSPAAPDTAYNFGNLLVGDVSRVEILRGPQSTLWGSQAIGGVINLITSRPTRALESDVDVEVGSNAWAMARAAVGGRSRAVDWRVNVASLSTTGISAFDKGAERDGFHNLGASATAEVRLGEATLDLRGFATRGRVEFDGFPPPVFSFADTDEYGIMTDLVGYAGVRLPLLAGRLENRLGLALTDTQLKNYDPAQAPSAVTFASQGRNRRLEYQGTWRLAEAWKAVFGAESERSSMRSAAPFSADINGSARLDSYYGQVSGDALPEVTLAAGVRRDEHSDFGGHTVGDASLAWRVTPGTVMRASWGEGFKAPSLYQLGSAFGNPTLRPERATGWDAAVEQHWAEDRISVSAAYFERRTRDQIDFATCLTAGGDPLCLGANGRPRFGYYANLARTRARGVELAAEAELTEALSLSANATWLDARNLTAGSRNYGHRLARRPSRQGSLDLTWRAPGELTAAIAVRAAGDAYDNAANTVRLKGYTVWDLRARYPVTGQVELYGRVENLFDRPYETIATYGQLRRAAYAGIRARF